MENSTSPTEQQNTTTFLDPQVESWKIAVPLILILLVAGVATGAVLTVLYYYKKCYKHRAVFPIIVIDEVDNAEPPNYRQSTIQKINKNDENSASKKSFHLTVVDSLKDFDAEFQPTRTKSLTVLVPEGESVIAQLCLECTNCVGM